MAGVEYDGSGFILKFPKTGRESNDIEFAEDEKEMLIRVPFDIFMKQVASGLYQLYKSGDLTELVGVMKANLMFAWAKSVLNKD